MSVRIRLLLAACGWCCAALSHAAPASSSDALVSEDASYALRHVLDAEDNEGLPFAIVDKRVARIFVFEGAGRLIGASAALLGSTHGDRAVADTALRHPGRIDADERSMPAGRFAAEPGLNDKGEAIVWIDYEASIAIHRLRPVAAHERREARLASSSPDDNRISFGCIVVPVDFYESVVWPTLGRGKASSTSCPRRARRRPCSRRRR